MKYSKIVSIEECGEENVYDIEMPKPNNYVANKMVVHNSGQTKLYVNRVQGLEEAKPFHPLLANITQDTLHIIIFQEQVMQVMNQIGGMSWAAAETVRKIITKSKGDSIFKKMREEFITNSQNIHKLKREESEKIYDVVSTFGCLAGNTKIYKMSVNQNSSSEMTIKEAFEYQENNHFQHKSFKILAMSADGYIRPHLIKKIYYIGKKSVYIIKTSSNKSIKATENHRFLVNGKWVRVKDIEVGDSIMVSSLVLTEKVYSEKIEEIEYSSDREVFDIEMDGAPRNFIANNFVSHNSYGFNKSHAVGYSVISYYCAWLKYYYPVEFFYALLSREKDKEKIFAYMQDAENNNVAIMNLDINLSKESYAIVNGKIYAGFSAIIGIASRTANKIVKNQPFKSYEDFNKRCKLAKKLVIGLIVGDAFRDFNINKEEEIKKLDEEKKYLTGGFTKEDEIKLIYELTQLKPKESIRNSFSFGDYDFIDIKDLANYAEKQVLIRGLITQVINKDKLLRKTLDQHVHKFEHHLFYLNVNDDTGNMACVIQPNAYHLYKELIGDLDKQPVIILGKVSKDGNRIAIDLLQIVGKTQDIDKFLAKKKVLNNGENIVMSAIPAVSKKGNSYYRILLDNGTEGLVFNCNQRLVPGKVVKKIKFDDPFINFEVIS